MLLTENRLVFTASKYLHEPRYICDSMTYGILSQLPRDVDYASLIESTEPVIVQHTRLDSRDPSIALSSSVAFHGEESGRLKLPDGVRGIVIRAHSGMHKRQQWKRAGEKKNSMDKAGERAEPPCVNPNTSKKQK